MRVRDWSGTAASNTLIGTTSIAEGCDPGNLNDAARELMAEVRSDFPMIGTTAATTDGSGIISVTFPATFTSTPAVMVCNGDSNNGPTDLFTVVLASITTTGFNCKVYTSAGAAAASVARRVNWIAMVA